MHFAFLSFIFFVSEFGIFCLLFKNVYFFFSFQNICPGFKGSHERIEVVVLLKNLFSTSTFVCVLFKKLDFWLRVTQNFSRLKTLQTPRYHLKNHLAIHTHNLLQKHW